MDFGRGLCYASPSMRYDAIVVGAGPAGSYAAYLLAQRGAAVALLDRSAFPRDKPCGGALSHAHQRFLFDRIARSPRGRARSRDSTQARANTSSSSIPSSVMRAMAPSTSSVR